MARIHAPANARTSEPIWAEAARIINGDGTPGPLPQTGRFRTLDTDDINDCLAAVDQAEAAQKAIHEAVLHVAEAVHRIRELAEPLARMTGRQAVDDQLHEAERCATNTVMRLNEMLIDVTCEQTRAADAQAKLWVATGKK